MKALFALKSAIDQSQLVSIAILISLASVIYPEVGLAESLQASQGNQTALIFELKDPKSTQSDNNAQTNSITYQDTVQNDPLTANVKNYLVAHGSPFAEYTDCLLSHENWKLILSISQVESNMGIHHYYYNSSGIGGQKYLRKYDSYCQWMDDMSNLLSTRYEGWSLDRMNGVYVQPRSYNWGYGSQKTLDELTELQNQSEQQKVALANSQVNGMVTTASQDVQIAKFELK